MDIDTPSSPPPVPRAAPTRRTIIQPATPLQQHAAPPSSPDLLSSIHAPTLQDALQPKSKPSKRSNTDSPNPLANHFAYDLPPTRTLPANWNRPGPCWKRFTTHRELTSRRQDMPSQPLTTSDVPVATPILDPPETPGTPLHPNNQPPLQSKASSMHSDRTWIRSSPPSPTFSATTATTEDTLEHHTQRL
jgi:hypothetical protein